MSVLYNPLIMGGKLAVAFPPKKKEEKPHGQIWGKSHMELRGDTQFVRFWSSGDTTH
jgi:hypothetical protein